MNYNVNSSGIYDVNAFNLTSKNVTVLSSLNVSGYDILTLINNSNTTSNTNFNNNLNSLSTNSTLSINNLNATSTTFLGILNNHTTQINNLNATSTTIFNNLNSLSGNSTLSINNISTNTYLVTPNNISVNGNNPYYNLGGTGGLLGYVTTLPQTFSTSATYTDCILKAPLGSQLLLQTGAGAAGIILNTSNFVVLNNRTTCANTFNVSGASTLNVTTCLSSLNVSGNTTLQNASTCLSSLNVSGNIIGSGTALTNLNYNAILNPPAIANLNLPVTCSSSLNVSGNTTLQNASTCLSSLNVSGTTLLSSTLNVTGNSYLYSNAYLFSTNNPAVFLGVSSCLGLNSTNQYFSTSGIINDLVLKSSLGYKLIFQSGNGSAAMYVDGYNNVYFNNASTCLSSFNVSGNTIFQGASTHLSTLNVSGITVLSNNVVIGNNAPRTKLEVYNGSIFACGTSSFAIPSGFNTQVGSLTLGDTTLNYGGGYQWTSSVAQILLECSDNTEIAVHDNGNRLASLMYYQGGAGTTGGIITIGRNMGYNALTSLVLNGALTLANNIWHQSADGISRFYYNANGTTYFHSGNTNGNGFTFRNTAQGDIVTITDAGNTSITGTLTVNGTTINGTTYLNGTTWVAPGNKISCADNFHSIYFNQGANILQLQEYGTIQFSIGPSYSVMGYFDSNGLTVSTIINVGGTIIFSGAWLVGNSIAPNGVINSFVFQHRVVSSGINSFWWFNGTQTSTSSEISDERIKKNIQPVNNALSIVNKLQPRTFDLIDDKDVCSKYGFISQEVEAIPELTKLIFTTTDFICNINSYGTHNNTGDGKAIITANNNINGLIDVGDNIKLVFNNNDKNNLEIIIDETPYKNRYKRRYVEVLEIIDDYSFVIDKELTIDETDPLYIYGKEVNDFKHLDYQSFHALNTSAIQELYKIIEELKKRVEILENK